MKTEFKVVTAGSDRQIAFPNLCVNCNMPADGRLCVQRIFERFGSASGGGDDGIFKVVTSFNVLFCHACINIHKQEEVPLTWQNWLVTFLMGGILIIPAAAIFFPSLNLWREFLQALTSVDLILCVFYGAYSVLSLRVVSMLFVGARHQSRPHLLVPSTSITSAIDFSDRLDGERSYSAIKATRIAFEKLTANDSGRLTNHVKAFPGGGFSGCF